MRPDGSWLIDGLLDIECVSEKVPDFPLPPEAGHDFQTLAGFVVHRLEQVPKEGDCLAHGAWNIEVIDMDGSRVDKLLLLPQAPPPGPEPEPPVP
jgi:putative hemolysin